MSISAKTFVDRFEEFCPLWLAQEGDPVGLQIGTLNRPIQRVMMTLDIRPEVVQEAIEKKIDLLIAKHPVIFRPIDRLVTDDPQTKMYVDLAAHNISVYVAHTNMDIMENGLNDWFCDLLEIDVDTFLKRTHTISYKKLIVYVPCGKADEMRTALAKAGAGRQGKYEATSYSMSGMGRFTPLPGSNPAIGSIRKPEVVQEERIEVIFLESLEQIVLEAMFSAHPYEEPAYDLLTLANPPKAFGVGRVGKLRTPQSLEQLISTLKEVFKLDGLRVTRSAQTEELIETVAICGGSGQSFYPEAIALGADVFITGDVYYHTAHDMQTNGLTVIDPGHYIEELCIPKFTEKMLEWNQEEGWGLEIFPSQTKTNPFEFN